MPSVSPYLWQAEQNTKIPADTHWFSYRAILAAANTAQTITIPSSQTNPAQVVFPGVAPTGQPQAGRRFVCTKIIVRDANGAVGGTGGGSVNLNDVTQGLLVAGTGPLTVTAAGGLVPYQIQLVSGGTCIVNPNDVLAVQYVPPTSGTATATGFTLDVFGYFQQAI